MGGRDTTGSKALLAELKRICTAADELRVLPDAIRVAVRGQHTAMRRAIAEGQMATIPVARLKDTTSGLRLDALERAGYRTLDQILRARVTQLTAVPNVGDATATKAIAAARQIRASAEEHAKVRLDIEKQPGDQTELIDGLRRFAIAERAVNEVRPHLAWTEAIRPLIDAAEPCTRSKVRRLFMGREAKEAANGALDQLIEQADAAGQADAALRAQGDVAKQLGAKRSQAEIWNDYKQNAAELLAILEELTGAGGADVATHGELPTQIVERVKAQPLDLTYVKASLRGYQAFGAKFALAQRRTIVGDEMGLGKTVEALAALAHLRAMGRYHALVVCPASVVANWRNEIERHTKLSTYVIHGADRDRAAASWVTHGGVAITTFDGLKRLSKPAFPHNGDRSSVLPMLVVDEAHYAKNPTSGRSQAVADWAAASDYVLFLSGTPMENRVEEFRNLVHMLQPAVAQRLPTAAGIAGADVFRRSVAPAYLRRNQVDVLDELPERLDSLDWIDPTSDDLATYRAAVGGGSFMAMRRAAFMSVQPNGGALSAQEIARSAKLSRLVDIIEEAGEEDLKVIVFSFFRDVLDVVTAAARAACPGAVYGALTGSVPPHERQKMVDDLSRHEGRAVLTAQIEAGGTGLNIQAASVVVLCEPQWKPTIESQAIARAHRMGQVRRVQVHRLLTPESVDQRMLAILAGKQQAFDAYVSRSDIKDITPEAIDVSDLEAVQRVASEAEAERQIVEAERRRLGFAIANGVSGSEVVDQ